MKKLILILLLVAACMAQTPYNDSRPYHHWKINFVKVDGEVTIKESILINTWDIKDAVSQFEVQCPYCEIRSVARDYYYICEER